MTPRGIWCFWALSSCADQGMQRASAQLKLLISTEFRCSNDAERNSSRFKISSTVGHCDPPATRKMHFGGRYSHLRNLSLIHISETTRLLSISYAVFCLKKKNY